MLVRSALLASAVNFTGVGALSAAASTDVTPWLSGGGAAAAVGGLAYIAKKLAAGELVAVPLARLIEDSTARERRWEQALLDSEQRRIQEKERDEEKWQRLLDDAHDREEAMRALLFSREIKKP